jgi:hypothetical protein
MVIGPVGPGLIDAPRRPAEAESGQPAQRGLDIDKKRQQEEPGPHR